MSKSDQNFNELFTNLSKHSQEWVNDLLNKQEGNNLKDNPFALICKQFLDNTKLFLESQHNFYQDQIKLWKEAFGGASSTLSELPQLDKRFAAEDWQTNPFFSYIKESYLSVSKSLVDFIAKSDMDQESKTRLNFFMHQYLNAISPTNFIMTNPEVMKAMVETKGQSLVYGMQNMMRDAKNGYMAMTDESQFAIGENLALTKGKVIFTNELIELIQYTPTTTTTYEIPILVVPPCINKYYILDLSESNSFVKYLVDQGYTVYLISWRSAVPKIKHYHWKEYVNLGVIKAIEVVREVSKKSKINTLGYCVGGVILTTAALVLKAQKLNWINSMTHMTVMLDHADPGDIKYFINTDLHELQEIQEHGGGIVSGRIISQTFSALRANELIWNYWINNYLMGKKPEAFDILFWNSDAVDLPVNMHSFLIKSLYIANKLVKGSMVVDGIKMDIDKLDFPLYVFASEKDHIVPWHSAYKTTHHVKKNVRFVLGASGHTAGVVNPVSTDKRNYWINPALPHDAQEWFNHATKMPGSWWKDLNIWLGEHSGDKVKAKKVLGNATHQPTLDAPGQYVRAKALTVLEASAI